MKKRTTILSQLFMICLTALLAGCNSSTDMEQQVNELYNKMSQEERIAQLRSMYMDELFDENGKLDTAKCRQLIPNGIGHFSQFCMQQPRDPNVLRDRAIAIQDWLMHNTPNGIPALLHEEVLSGVNTLGATIYPQQIGQAGSFNPELAELKTRQTSTQLRKMGGIFALSGSARHSLESLELIPARQGLCQLRIRFLQKISPFPGESLRFRQIPEIICKGQIKEVVFRLVF